MVGIGGLLGVRVFGWKGVGNLGISCWPGLGSALVGCRVRVFGWKGVGNLGIGKVDLLWTPGRRPADSSSVVEFALDVASLLLAPPML